MFVKNLVQLLAKLWQRSNLFASLYITFLVLVLLILGQQTLNLWIEHLNYQVAVAITHTLVVEREEKDLLNSLIDQEEACIKDYNQYQFSPCQENKSNFNFCNSFNNLYNLLQNNPAQLKQLNRINYLYDQWRSKLNYKTSSDDVSTSSYDVTKDAPFSELRHEIGILIESEEMLLDKRRNKLYQLSNINIAINIFSAVVILVAVGLNVQFLHRRFQVPLHELTEIAKLWRQGEMSVKFGYSYEDEIGQLARVLNAITDETQNRQKSVEVQNQQLEDMICALSHDLRAPLLAARNTLDGMIKGAFGEVSETWKEVLQEYRQSNEDILLLVEVMLNIGRYEAGGGAHLNYDPLNWEKIFGKVIAQIKASSKCELSFTYKISQSLPTVYGDELEIQRVMQNLLGNAVRVSEPLSSIFLEAAPFGEQVKVSVRDNGLGIATQDLEQLFHRFRMGRRKHGKAGLGLYLCRQIISAHSGTIGVESSLGEGSTFWFTLPLNTDKAKFHDVKEIQEKE